MQHVFPVAARLVALVSLLAGAVFLAPAGAQEAPDFEKIRALEPDSLTYGSFAKAWDALERAIEVHGGSTVGEAYSDIAMSFTGSGERASSQRFVGESVAYRVRGAVAFSSLFDAISFIEEISLGEQVFRGYTIICRDQLFHIPTGSDLPEAEADLKAERETVELLMPYHWLERASAARESLRWLGEHETEGRRLGALSFADGEGGATLLVDLDSAELRRVELLTTHFVQGDANGWIEFDEYEDVAGHRFPMVRRERSVEGQFVREAEIRFAAIRAETLLPANIFHLPPEYRFADASWTVTETPVAAPEPTAEWRTIAPGVHAVDLSEQANTQVIVIEREDACTVFNSPLTDALATEVLRAIEANLGGKPVREMVCATFHPRFAGGLRTYVGAGARIVTTPANEGYIRAVLQTPARLVSGVPEVTIGEDTLVLVDGSTTIGEGDERLELYDIGEQSNYTQSYLVGWHPGMKILLTSDLFAVLSSNQVRSASPRTQGLAAWLDEVDLEPVQFVPTSPINGHKPVMLPEDLDATVQAAMRGHPVVGPPGPE